VHAARSCAWNRSDALTWSCARKGKGTSGNHVWNCGERARSGCCAWNWANSTARRGARHGIDPIRRTLGRSGTSKCAALNSRIILRIEETVSLVLGRSPKQARIVVRTEARARQVAMAGMWACDEVGSESDAVNRGRSDGNKGHRFHSPLIAPQNCVLGQQISLQKSGETIFRQNRNLPLIKPRAQVPKNEDLPDGVRLAWLIDAHLQLQPNDPSEEMNRFASRDLCCAFEPNSLAPEMEFSVTKVSPARLSRQLIHVRKGKCACD